MPTFFSMSVKSPVTSLLDGWVCLTEPLAFPVKMGHPESFLRRPGFRLLETKQQHQYLHFNCNSNELQAL